MFIADARHKLRRVIKIYVLLEPRLRLTDVWTGANLKPNVRGGGLAFWKYYTNVIIFLPRDAILNQNNT